MKCLSKLCILGFVAVAAAQTTTTEEPIDKYGEVAGGTGKSGKKGGKSGKGSVVTNGDIDVDFLDRDSGETSMGKKGSKGDSVDGDTQDRQFEDSASGSGSGEEFRLDSYGDSSGKKGSSKKGKGSLLMQGVSSQAGSASLFIAGGVLVVGAALVAVRRHRARTAYSEIPTIVDIKVVEASEVTPLVD